MKRETSEPGDDNPNTIEAAPAEPEFTGGFDSEMSLNADDLLLGINEEASKLPHKTTGLDTSPTGDGSPLSEDRSERRTGDDAMMAGKRRIAGRRKYKTTGMNESSSSQTILEESSGFSRELTTASNHIEDHGALLEEKHRISGRTKSSTSSLSTATKNNFNTDAVASAGNSASSVSRQARPVSNQNLEDNGDDMLSEKKRIAGGRRRKAGKRTAAAPSALYSSSNLSTSSDLDVSNMSVASDFSDGRSRVSEDSMLNEKRRIAARGRRVKSGALSVAASEASRTSKLSNDLNDRDELAKAKNRPGRTGACDLAMFPFDGDDDSHRGDYANWNDAAASQGALTSTCASLAPGAFRVSGSEERPELNRDSTVRVGASTRNVSKEASESREEQKDDGFLIQAHVVDDDEDKDRGIIVTAEPTELDPWWRRNQAWLVGAGLVLLVGIIAAVVLTSINLSPSSNDAPTMTPTSFVQGQETETSLLISNAFSNTESAISDQSTSQYRAFKWVIDARLNSIASGSDQYTDIRVLQQYSLATLFFSTSSSNSSWQQSAGWLDSINECSWIGVDCGGASSETVIGVSLPGNGLNGTIPPDLAILSDSLIRLDLSENNLSGPIPSEIGDLKLLVNLSLCANDLTQSMPPSLGMLTELRFLDFSSNQLRSEIPREIGNLMNVRSISFANNAILGEIPSEIGMLANVQDLHFQGNRLAFPIPSEIGQLKRLENIRFQQNSLNGPIPTQIGLLESLLILDLSDNLIVDTIPTEISLLQNLMTLDLSRNLFRGPFLSDLRSLKHLSKVRVGENSLNGNLPSLRLLRETLTELDISENRMNGELPNSLWELNNLVTLNISSNQFSGIIPTEIGSLYELVELDMANNFLYNIMIPVELFNVTSLCHVDLSQNGLTGVIPTEIGMLTSATLIDLSQNLLSSTMPAQLGLMTSLRKLSLARNTLLGGLPTELGLLSSLLHLNAELTYSVGGTLPSEIGLLKNLLSLKLTSSGINGSIPVEWTTIATIEDIHLSSNYITGSIPAAISSMISLTTLDLEGNVVTGTIPSLGLLTNLEVLNIALNEMTGSLPQKMPDSLQVINLQDNNLTGSIGLDWSSLTNLKGLYLDGNSISGSIGTVFQSMSSLENLRLSSNQITGPLPSKLGVLTNLATLVLFSNIITGTIPSSIAMLQSLELLDLETNILSGTIPSEIGLLSNLFEIWFDNNGKIRGTLPSEIGKVSSLVWLSLSNTDISGAIPTEIEKLTNLGHLWIDQTLLTGSIPTSLCDSNSNQVFDFVVNCSIIECACCYDCSTPSAAPTPTPAPTQRPSASNTTVPTLAPSSPPSDSFRPTSTAGPTVDYTCGVFESIASFGTELSISQLPVPPFEWNFEVVDLPFGFRWLGREEIHQISIATGGFALVGASNNTWGAAPRIDVAEVSIVVASIYTVSAKDYFIVSWEQAQTGDPPDGESALYFQLVLYPEGIIEFRWGEARFSQDFFIVTSGLSDGTSGLQNPTIGSPFSEYGYTFSWPSNQCRRFYPVGGGYGQLVPPTLPFDA